MKYARIWRPLVARSTFRRGVHLFLGGVILAPYLLLTVGFVQMFRDPETPVVPVGLLALVTFAIGAAPPFLLATRALEITAARNLLDVDLPDPGPEQPWETRLLSAMWYTLHLLSGGLAILAVLVAAPIAAFLVAQSLGAAGDWNTGGLTALDAVPRGWGVPVAIVSVLAVGYLVAALGALLSRLAPALLGPSPADRIRGLEARARELSERNRLARELHDSIGHALTVTTLQAAAARRVLTSDPEFVRRALTAVEDTGRAAMADLDHVLGVLRSDGNEPANESVDGAGQNGPAPQPDLRDVAALVEQTRATGVEIELGIDGSDHVAPAVSREAYRIVQEGLTNAVRHAGRVPIAVAIRTTADGIDIEVTNPLAVGETSPAGSGGRGLAGMRERVRILHGELFAGRDGARWRIHAQLPAGSKRVGESEDGGGAKR